MAKSKNYLALVLKCQRSGERDLLVTLVTRQHGRLLTVAKGVRQLTSTRRSCLQAGNLIHAQLSPTASWPILAQATLVSDTHTARTQLTSLRKFLLYLEILDRLLVSEELDSQLFTQILTLRELLLRQVRNDLIQSHFQQVLAALGFSPESPGQSVSQQVNAILDTRLRSFDYLSVRG